MRFLLRDHQLESYDAYRAWELLDPATQPGQFARVYNDDIGRRWGKTTKRFLVRTEDCLRNEGRIFRSITAYQKDIESIIDEVAQAILETCPPQFRPEYKGSHGAQGPGFYFPHNGSVLKLAGLDKHPNALRGHASDGDDISEAAYLRHLERDVKNVIYAQYQGRPWARLCLESSGPSEVDGDYDRIFVADAKLREAANREQFGIPWLGYYYATIDDNTHLEDSEREEFIRAAGGREHHDCQREYFNIRVRDPERVLVPEFSRAKHVGRVDPPEYAHWYQLMDPGIQDPCGIVYAYWHHELGKLVIPADASWAESNAGFDRIADVTREMDARLITQHRWDAKARRMLPPGSPLARISDVDLQLVHNLAVHYDLHFQLADKSTQIMEGKHHSTLMGLRRWFGSDLILIDPDAGPVLEHVEKGKWNERRTDWERTAANGHFDCLAALKYGPRHIDRQLDPTPPLWAVDFDAYKPPDEHRPEAPKPVTGVSQDTHGALGRVFGQAPAWKHPGRPHTQTQTRTPSRQRR